MRPAAHPSPARRPRTDNDDGIAIHGQYSLVVDKLEAPGSPDESFSTEVGGGGTEQPGPWLPWSGQLWLTHAECELPLVPSQASAAERESVCV